MQATFREAPQNFEDIPFETGKLMKIGYMCGVDFQHELGEAHDPTPIYASIKALKQYRKCWVQCGIVKVEVKIKKWIVEQDFRRVE